jgi:hypothetical protein
MSDRFPSPSGEGPAPIVQAPTPGLIVMVRLPVSGAIKPGSHGQPRPAIVTRMISPTQANVQVFLDGPNDAIASHVTGETMWLGTVDYAPPEFNAPRTWHWPPRVGG